MIRLALRVGIVSGAVYDFVVGWAAAQAGATLLSLDRRVVPTYRAAGVKYDLLS
ncbi:hypothetical protein WEH80_16095 [Actinomycetes bacterium KLBMP 9759]